MSLSIVFLPEAQAEFDEAVDWYEQQAGLGAEFIARVQEVLNRIGAIPQLHQVIYRDVRRALVQRFPYSILYRVEAAQILIIAVFHSRRDPSIWQARA